MENTNFYGNGVNGKVVPVEPREFPRHVKVEHILLFHRKPIQSAIYDLNAKHNFD